MRLQSIWLRTLLVIPLRLGLGLVWLVAAHLAGARWGPALLAFALGTGGLAFAATTDPRRKLLHRDPDPLPAPGAFELEPWWRHAAAALFPSTFGVSVLAAIALVPEPVLAALLGGVCAGLGVAAVLAVPQVDRTLLVEPRSRAVYRRP